MNKLEQLRQAIDAVPAGYGSLWSTMSLLFSDGELGTLRAYVTGARTMALHLTSDEPLLKSLSDIEELLK